MTQATLHAKHMQLIDAVNNATTPEEKETAEAFLNGWLEGLELSGVNIGPMLLDADREQMARGHDIPMCCGVFIQ